jgi:mono/diheme cytochrome c family protein
MKRSMRTGILSFAAGVVATLAVAAGIVLAVAYSGGYNIAATEEHASFTRWVFDTTFRRSIESRAAAVTAPADMSAALVATGAREYKEYCQHCHAGPGVERAPWASGMRPRPPHLTEAAAHWEMAEVFWLAKHGAKMTGMPAFGPGHDDETLWGIAAFVKQLPAMTPDQFASAGGGGEAQHGAEPTVLPEPAGGG